MRRVIAALLAASLASVARAEGSAAVEDGKVVAIEYTLALEDGKVVATNVGGEPLVLVEGRGEVFSGLERALAGMAVGESKQGVLAAKEAYGEVDPKLFVEVEATRIPEADRHAGAQVMMRDGSGREKLVRIHEVRGDRVVVDLNHALAGNPIRYEVRVLRVEAPPPER
jgi:FKBP-type peptidyl-prolyl cis-trans isomerase SlyD